MTSGIITAAHSHYPKIGDGAGEQQLRQAYHRLDRGELAGQSFKEIENDVVRQVIRAQEEAGLDIVTDGLVRWNDPISHQLRKVANIKIAGLLRFFDTNCYFRQPVVTGPIRTQGSVLPEEVRFLAKTTRRIPKVVLTGPYTLAVLSKIETKDYADRDELMEDYADLVASEIAASIKAGAQRIQIDEPALLQNPGDADKVLQALTGVMRKETGVRLELALYFGDAAPLVAPLAEFPVDGVIFDITYSPRLIDILAERRFPSGVGLGIIDGRNTRLEKVDELIPQIKKVAQAIEGELVLTTSCGLEYLPRDRARAKLELLTTLKEKCR